MASSPSQPCDYNNYTGYEEEDEEDEDEEEERKKDIEREIIVDNHIENEGDKCDDVDVDDNVENDSAYGKIPWLLSLKTEIILSYIISK